MTIGFAFIGQASPVVACATRMVASARRVMPGTEIVQWSDARATPIPGVDRVERRPVTGPLALGCLELYAAAPAGEWLLLDTDTIVQQHVAHVFATDFDIAVARRDGTFTPGEAGTKFMTTMPYNKGVVFSRSPTFWAKAVETLRTMKPARQEWMGDQHAMNAVISEWGYRVHVLDARYNYPPKSKTDLVDDKAILHFKGKRKAWLLERAA